MIRTIENSDGIGSCFKHHVYNELAIGYFELFTDFA